VSLVLKRGKFSRPSGQWQDEDYDVLADGKAVGRIYEDADLSTPPDMRWFWSVLVITATQARDAVERRSWSHPQEPTTEEWWADVLADPRARTPKRRGSEVAVERTFYRLADEPREVILVACSKCDWKAAFLRAELIALHGSDYPMPSLLERLAAPGCAKVGSQWDRCGVHHVEPIETNR
jgi:hypothetical protein